MENIELLAQIQERIIECRRTASETPTPRWLCFSIAWPMRSRLKRAKLT